MKWWWSKADTPPPPTAAAEAAIGGVEIDKLNADLSREYVRSIYLWRAVDILGSMSASVPLIVVKKEENMQLSRTDMAVGELLQRPNPQWTFHATMYFLAVSLAVANRAFLLRVRGTGDVTQELWPLAVSDVQPIYRLNSPLLEKFQVMFGGEMRTYAVNEDGDSDIIFIRRPALNHQTDKAPAVIAAAPAEVFTRVLQRAADIASNSSNITGVLNTEAEMTDAAVQKVKDKIMAFRTGEAQSGGTLVTANAKWNLTRLSEDPSTALSVAIKDSLARDVVMTFGVPTQLVGLPGSDTYNNLAQARVGLLTETILPGYVGLIVSSLNLALMRNGARIAPDVEHVPSMIAYRQQMVDTAARATMLSINEQRALLGYPRFEGGGQDEDYIDADVPIKLEELRLKKLAITAQMGGVSTLLGGQQT